MFWRNLDARVGELVRGAEREVLLVAPFITRAAFQTVLERIPSTVRVQVYTRWRVEEIAAGVSDPSILELLTARGDEDLRLCDELHVKLFVADGCRALVGSANITGAALGLSPRPNLELLHAVPFGSPASSLFLKYLKHRSRAATADEAADLIAKAEAFRKTMPPDAPLAPDAQGTAQSLSTTWIPAFRSPDRLYRVAIDAEWLAQAGPSDPALRDLLTLQPTLDSGQAAFNESIRAALRAAPLLQALDAFLVSPQRFGALSQWLSQDFPDLSHSERQTAAQTLIRWITYFDPDRYKIGTPGRYSEILSLNDRPET